MSLLTAKDSYCAQRCAQFNTDCQYTSTCPSSLIASDSKTYDPPVCIGGIFMLLMGLCLCFGGARIQKLTCFTAGFYVWGLCLLFILGASNVTEKMTVHSHWIVLLLVSVAGLIGGMFSRKVVYLALIEIGLLFGLAIALIFLLVGFASIVYDYARLGYFAVLLGVCGWLAYMREKHLLIVGSALPGALSIMVGIDVFAQTGLAMKMFQALALVRFYPQDVSPAAWGLLAVSFVLFAFGCVVQSLPVFPLTPTMDRHDRPTMGYWPWSVPTMRMPWPIPKAPPPMSSPPAVMPLPHH